DPNLQRLPMPVRWIYVLQDGTLTAPDSTLSTGTTAQWKSTGVTTPTKSNPIVGRVGFWADDETCKVNINTAGGFVEPSPADFTNNVDGLNAYGDISSFPGSYWDTPHFNIIFDKGDAYPDGKGVDNQVAGTPKPGG